MDASNNEMGVTLPSPTNIRPFWTLQQELQEIEDELSNTYMSAFGTTSAHQDEEFFKELRKAVDVQSQRHARVMLTLRPSIVPATSEVMSTMGNHGTEVPVPPPTGLSAGAGAGGGGNDTKLSASSKSGSLDAEDGNASANRSTLAPENEGSSNPHGPTTAAVGSNAVPESPTAGANNPSTYTSTPVEMLANHMRTRETHVRMLTETLRQSVRHLESLHETVLQKDMSSSFTGVPSRTFSQ